jgi:hypothetical protein
MREKRRQLDEAMALKMNIDNNLPITHNETKNIYMIPREKKREIPDAS